MLRRRGRFMIHEDMAKRDPESARLILAECVVVSCEFSFKHRAFMIEATSHHFENIEDACEPVDYCPQLLTLNVGTDEEPKYEKRFDQFVRIPQP